MELYTSRGLHLLDNRDAHNRIEAICLHSMVCGGHTSVGNGSI